MSKQLQDIWKISDANTLIIEMLDYISEKCHYGDKMSTLSVQERIFYIAQQVEMEINNGGFDQFFFNPSGNFSNEIVWAFIEIGAHHTADICKKALSAIGGEIPADRDSRQELLDELESEELSEIFNECDTAFLEYQDDLTTLNYKYIMGNKSFIS